MYSYINRVNAEADSKTSNLAVIVFKNLQFHFKFCISNKYETNESVTIRQINGHWIHRVLKTKKVSNLYLTNIADSHIFYWVVPGGGGGGGGADE